jgi:mevalonate kinase
VKKTFYSNGKLLITAEYLVLDGAKALALPTKMGQNLSLENGNNNVINWTSFDHDGSIWFEDVISFLDIKNKAIFENQSVKTTLIEILHEAYLLNPNFIDNASGYIISTQLTFPKFWGLGTSSTLINNIAQWLEVDAFVLLNNSFGGSGYDIACAQNNTPILYQLQNGKPIIESVTFNPEFTKNLYFVYLNQKQNSKTAIANYYKRQNNLNESIPVVNSITNEILHTSNIRTLAALLEKHEIIMSDILEMQTVKENLFPDFDGVIKSLGAWGGDFVMVVSKENPIPYFKDRGYKTIVPYHDMILELI